MADENTTFLEATATAERITTPRIGSEWASLKSCCLCIAWGFMASRVCIFVFLRILRTAKDSTLNYLFNTMRHSQAFWKSFKPLEKDLGCLKPLNILGKMKRDLPVEFSAIFRHVRMLVHEELFRSRAHAGIWARGHRWYLSGGWRKFWWLWGGCRGKLGSGMPLHGLSALLGGIF